MKLPVLPTTELIRGYGGVVVLCIRKTLPINAPTGKYEGKVPFFNVPNYYQNVPLILRQPSTEKRGSITHTNNEQQVSTLAKEKQ